jgi:hypothetical protein
MFLGTGVALQLHPKKFPLLPEKVLIIKNLEHFSVRRVHITVKNAACP